MLLAIAILIFCLILYTYVGYPLLLRLMVWVYGRRSRAGINPPTKDEDWPAVSVVLTMHNGQQLVRTKLANLEAIDYRGPLSVNFVLDGCTDQTEETIQQSIRDGFRFPVSIWHNARRQGKEAAIRNAMPNLAGPVLLFSDADAQLAPQALEHLVAALLQDGVGVVCGREVHQFQEGTGAGSGQGAFYRYETFIKSMLGELSSLTYIQGGVFAMWKDLYPPDIPAGATQDGAIAFHCVLSGKRVAYAADAVSVEPYDISTGADFARRVRTISRAFYSICCYPRALTLSRFRHFGLHLISSRLLRWLTIPIAIVANLFLIYPLLEKSMLAWIIVALELAWGALALVGYWSERKHRRWKLPYFFYYFTYIHLAAFAAIVKVALGSRTTTWKPTTH